MSKGRTPTVELCRRYLFADNADMEAEIGADAAERVFKARAMYLWRLANPEAKDRQFLEEFRARFPMGKNAAHEYLNIVNSLLPALSEKSRQFHRWRYNEMILETYQLAKKRKDTKTMERAASSYARFNKVDEEEAAIPYHLVQVQPFIPTDDPRVLGIEPIPNLRDKINALIKKYSADSIDILDVDFEEADVEEDALFNSDAKQGLLQ